MAVKVAATPLVSKTGDTMTGELVVPDLKVAGIGTATQGGRFVGVTSSGAPTTGTWAVGDFCFDLAGHRYFCTVAGTPGTWIADTSERAYAADAGAATQFTVANAASDMPSLSTISFTVYSGEVMYVEGNIPKTNSGASASGVAYITDGSNTITALGYGVQAAAAGAAATGALMVRERITTAGSYSRKLRVQSFTGNVTYGSGSTQAPSTIRAYRA